MKKFYIIILLITISIGFASEIDDLKFAIGLYSDGNNKLAKSELDSFIIKYPESKFLDDAKYILANTLLKQKDYLKAQKYYKYLYEQNSNPAIRAEVMQNLAQTYFMVGNYSQSELIFEKFINEFAHHDKISQALYFLGKIKQKNEDYSAALDFYNQAEKVATIQISKINAAQMKMLIALGKSDESDLLYDKVLKNGNGDYRELTIVLWIESKLSNEEFSKIIQSGLNRVRSDSEYFQDYKLLIGITYFEMNKLSEAREFLQDLKSEKARYYFALSSLKDDAEEAKKILQKLQKSSDMKLATNSYFYLSKLENDKKVAIIKLEKFIEENPNHAFIGTAYFQIGYNHCSLGNYQFAKDNLVKAKISLLDKNNLEKANFLLAESLYNLKEYDLADRYFNEYLENQQNKLFRDEAIYKRALHYYRDKDYLKAKSQFSGIEGYPDSDKLGMSRFYIGEIYLIQGKNNLAQEAYNSALGGITDNGFVQLRLAKIAFLQNDYPAADTLLNRVPERENYLYDKNLIAGNILFAKTKYIKALAKYIEAEKFVIIDSERENILSKKAWTLYQLKRFEQSAKIYTQLASFSATADEYIYKAANSAFSAENYDLAITLFLQYQNKFTDQKYPHQAQIAIADSYYNLGNYHKAISSYEKLFLLTSGPDILTNAINGLRWSCKLSEADKFSLVVDKIVKNKLDSQIEQMLLAEKVNFAFAEKEWKLTIKSVQYLEKRISKDFDIYDFKLMQALSYAHLEDVKNARKIFMKLAVEKDNADLLYNWAILELNQNNREFALTHLKKAIEFSQNPDIWLKLLEVEEMDIPNYYSRFIKFANKYDAAKAELILMKWKIDNADYAVEENLAKLKKINYKDVQAQAQYLLGYNLYKQKKLVESARELLRVRYLYPEINDVRVEAEYLACLCYLEADRKEEAAQLYDAIKAELPQSMRSEIESFLSGENR